MLSGLIIALSLLLPATLLAAEWKRINDPPAAPQTMLVLTNGDVMTLTSDRGPNSRMEDRSQIWMRLSPDALGDYSNGSWRFTAPMSIPRLFFASNIVRDTRLIVIGGEYSGIGLQPNWTRTGEAYNPATDTWQAIAPHPESQFGDDPTILLDGDRILAGSLFTRNTWIYHYPSDTWEENPIPKVYDDRSDEETWVKCPADVSSTTICSSPFVFRTVNSRRFSTRSQTSGYRRPQATARPLDLFHNFPTRKLVSSWAALSKRHGE